MRDPEEITHNGKTLAEWLELNKTTDVDLSDANLRSANLRGAYLSGANLNDAYLSDADLSDADLRDADLSGANLRGADLRGADLRDADLSGAYLRGADLSYAYLSYANLSGANLRGANLSGADLSDADLSGAKGLLSASQWMRDNFKTCNDGYIVYKGSTSYDPPAGWYIDAGRELTEVCNPTRTQECGCGVNFGTVKFIREKYQNSIIWECLIKWADLPDVCVPYNTDGKARCERLTLIKVMKVNHEMHKS